jgi:flagellar motor protein MotB
MKKMIFIIIIAFGLVFSACGQVKLYTDQLIMDSTSFNGTSWINEWSTDGTFGGNSDRAVPTEKAVKTYVGSQIGTAEDSLHNHANKGTLDAITNAFTTAKNNNLTEAHDSLHRHANKGTLDATTSAYTIAKDAIADEAGDSLHRHANKGTLDALTSEPTDSLHHHANKVTLDNTTASYTTASATRLADIRDTMALVINATTDTLTSTEVFSGGIFPIGLELNGWNVYRVQAFSPDEGDGNQSLKVYRIRGGATTTITSSGAAMNGTAVIDPLYDDMLTGDYLNFGFAETGTSDYTIGVDVIITFLRP